jgi:phosphoglycolate phosphatase-like HAD superfamily hydrolase
MTKHWFFDFDGVLCDSLAFCREEYQRLRDTQFPSLPPLNGCEQMDVVFDGPLKTCLHRWLSQQESRVFFDNHSRAMERHSGALRPYAGVRELLRGMPEQSISIVSSAYGSAIKRVLQEERGGLPASIATMDGRDSNKNKTEKIRTSLERMQKSLSEAVYVGDMYSDLLYCEDVPIDCMLVTYGYQSRGYLSQFEDRVVALVDSVGELSEAIKPTGIDVRGPSRRRFA